MFNKKSSRPSLALFVALALGSGALLAPSAAGAADVSGNDVVIDDTHAPSNNVVDAANHIRGTAAGFVKDTADSRNVKDNKLTLRNFTYANQVFGGFTWGTGHVTGNKVFIHPATAPTFIRYQWSIWWCYGRRRKCGKQPCLF